MYKLLVVILYVGACHALPCGDCICSEWMGTLSCTGPEVKSIPDLKDSSWIGHVDILNTSVLAIPRFESSQWNSLFTLDISSNELLDCDQVYKLQERNDLIVLSDCILRISEGLTETSNMQCMNILAIIPVICSAMIIAILKKKRQATGERRNEALV